MTQKIRNEIHGLLLADKGQDWTSFDVVNCVKHTFHPTKIGHCGTLDPMATGLLVILLGKATKLQDALMGEHKTYEGSLRLGIETDTEDSTGSILAEHDASAITPKMLGEAVASMVGVQRQVPPMVSAIKKNGKPLYELARQGISIPREAREITVFSFELISVKLPDAIFRVHCTKGTYVRTLCADIGRKLGCGAIMTSLRRTQCGNFSVAQAHSIETIRSWSLEQLRQALMPIEAIKADCPKTKDAGSLPPALETPCVSARQPSLPASIQQLSSKRIAVAMGIFDGVHLGHQAIMRELVALAKATEATPVALFFSPHPKAILFGTPPLCLTSVTQKARLLQKHGATEVVCIPFTRELAAKRPDEFLQLFLTDTPVITGFCVGDDWRFGCQNIGDANALATWAKEHHLECRLVKQVCHEGQPVSSTRIRAEIRAGHLENAATMLGRLPTVSGIVRHGNGIGKSKLDCPTANLCEPEQQLPPYGVYAATAEWEGRSATGIVYVGEAPTIRNQGPPVVITELHLFDVHEQLYGKEMSVSFHQFIRPSIRFNSPAELQRQIALDIQQVKAIFNQGQPR